MLPHQLSLPIRYPCLIIQWRSRGIFKAIEMEVFEKNFSQERQDVHDHKSFCDCDIDRSTCCRSYHQLRRGVDEQVIMEKDVIDGPTKNHIPFRVFEARCRYPNGANESIAHELYNLASIYFSRASRCPRNPKSISISRTYQHHQTRRQSIQFYPKLTQVSDAGSSPSNNSWITSLYTYCITAGFNVVPHVTYRSAATMTPVHCANGRERRRSRHESTKTRNPKRCPRKRETPCIRSATSKGTASGF